MAKKRKTRAQKKLADLRHDFTHVRTLASNVSFELKQQAVAKTQAKTIIVPQNTYPYLKRDLSKTALITIGILIFQAILFTSLRNHIFVIPGLSF